VRPEGLGTFNKNHLIGYRTRDFPVCNSALTTAVPTGFEYESTADILVLLYMRRVSYSLQFLFLSEKHLV
jgi:hypothetical protein